MLILAMDLAKQTGWALGVAGQRPASGSFSLRDKGEDIEQEPFGLARELRALCKDGLPHRIVVEAPLEAAAKWNKTHDNGKNYAQSASLKAQMIEHGALLMWAAERRIPVSRVSASTVRKHVCGFGRAEDRAATKRMVVTTMIRLGLLPTGCTDDDRADAVCIWRWAEDFYAGVQSDLVLLPT